MLGEEESEVRTSSILFEIYKDSPIISSLREKVLEGKPCTFTSESAEISIEYKGILSIVSETARIINFRFDLVE